MQNENQIQNKKGETNKNEMKNKMNEFKIS